jgi:uncharacterized protein (TIGR02246 family)
MTPQPTTDHAPRTPEDLLRRYAFHVGEGDLDGLMALYAPDAVFVPAPGVVHTGKDAIREALAAMLALSPALETRILEVHTAADIALAIVEWTMRGTAPDGSPVSQAGRSADVFRRLPDGSWRVLIDRP